MHQIGRVGQVNLQGRIFELELEIHHRGKTYEECERDCPRGWEIPTYFLLQEIRNTFERDRFSLLNTSEYVQNPDNISSSNDFVAWFDANSDGAVLNCVEDPAYRNSGLGVRYVREFS